MLVFLSEETECFRQFAVEFIRLCIDDKQDPMLRFANTESGEACGNVFFETLSPIAENLAKKRNLTLRFFGDFHLELETGHVLNSERVFKHEQLSAEQCDAGIKLAERMFKVFNDINDAFNDYLLTYIIKHFNSFEINNLDFKRISNTIDFIFLSLEKNLDSLLEAAKENVFAVR